MGVVASAHSNGLADLFIDSVGAVYSSLPIVPPVPVFRGERSVRAW